MSEPPPSSPPPGKPTLPDREPRAIWAAVLAAILALLVVCAALILIAAGRGA